MVGLIAYRRNRHQPHRQLNHTITQAGGLLVGLLSGVLLVALLTLAGCSTLRFYQQAVTGQARLLAARQDVDNLLTRQDLDPALQAALLDSQKTLDFARTQLLLDSEGRYDSYVDLNREFVVWNLVVTPVDSVQPLTWCFPVAGCVSYRGYFGEQLARDTGARFDPGEFDTYVAGVPAYSTLGWFDDPLLSSFIFWPRAARAELLFHELAHGKLYVPGDTEFNESFATYVADYALALFLRDDAAVRDHRRVRAERARFNQLLLKLRTRLEADFAQLDAQVAAAAHSTRQRRSRALDLRAQRYAEAKACMAAVASEFVDGRWLRYFDQPANMARLSLVGAYQRWVGAFRVLHMQSFHGGKGFAAEDSLDAFYTAVQSLADLSIEARRAELESLGAKASEQEIQTERDNQYADDIECEALSNHAADGHLSG